MPLLENITPEEEISIIQRQIDDLQNLIYGKEEKIREIEDRNKKYWMAKVYDNDNEYSLSTTYRTGFCTKSEAEAMVREAYPEEENYDFSLREITEEENSLLYLLERLVSVRGNIECIIGSECEEMCPILIGSISEVKEVIDDIKEKLDIFGGIYIHGFR